MTLFLEIYAVIQIVVVLFFIGIYFKPFPARKRPAVDVETYAQPVIRKVFR